jgi:5'-phosphate synthase pdxT subunit
VLALQGDWQAHLRVLEQLGIRAGPVRTAAELAACDRLVLPGGESTAMLRLMASERLTEPLRQRLLDGMPVLATCAGVILLARGVEPQQQSLEVLDVDVLRNAYGRQVASSITPVHLQPALGAPAAMEGVFIRAPRIVRVGEQVEVLGHRGDDPVLVRQGPIIAATFHPELSAAAHRVYELLLGRSPAAAAPA